jgi:hypothetical protein
MQVDEAATRRWKEAHRTFWLDQGRFDAFRPAAAEIFSAAELTYIGLEAKLVALTGSSSGDRSRSLSRYIKEGSSKPRDYSVVTALCVVLSKTCEQRSAKLVDHGEAVAVLARLAQEASDELPAFLPAPASTPATGRGYRPENLRKILEDIQVPRNGDDPDRPEFPPDSPRFPATPEVVIQNEPFMLMIKDESWNPTGSHKDRWAWEKLLWYRSEIERALSAHGSRKTPVQLRAMSMISSGSAALALQTLLRLHGLPPLRVVMDGTRPPPGVIPKLESIGAVVYRRDLDQAFLKEFDVLDATDNVGGFEITTRDIATPEHECFYDWLVCEILLLRPTYIFVPFGTGDLFTNILAVLANEATAKARDKRLGELSPEDLQGIHVLGATTDNPQTRMDKLYAKHRPTEDEIDLKRRNLIATGIIGERSAVIPIADSWAVKAAKIARDQNIRTELSGIAGLGLFLSIRAELPLTEKDVVVVVNTGWMHVS